MPAMAPTSASARPSMTSCRRMRARAAPRAARTAISRSRSAARASSRFATFTIATSRTTMTAPSRSIRAERTSPVMTSLRNSTRYFAAVRLGNCCRTARSAIARSACASSILASGFISPSPSKKNGPRRVGGVAGRTVHNWPRLDGNANPSGATPMIVNGCPSIVSVRPIAPGSELSRVVQ